MAEEKNPPANESAIEAESTFTPKPKSGGGIGGKMLVLGVVLFVCFIFAVLFGGTAYAYTSNKDVPVFSDALEIGENLILTDDQTAQVVQDDMKDFVFSYLLTMAESEDDGILNVTATPEEVEAYIQDKTDTESLRYEGNVGFEVEDVMTTDLAVDGIYNPGNFSLSLDGAIESDEATIDIAGELMIIDDKTFLKFDELPTAILGIPELDQAKGIWLESSATDTGDLAGTAASGYVPGAAAATGSEIDADSLKDIADFIDSDEIGNNITRLDDEVIEGVRTNCFELYLDQDGLEALLQKAAELSGTEYTDEELEATVGMYEYVSLVMCSGRKDGQIYRVEVDISLISDTDPTTLYYVELKMWDHNNVEDSLEEPTDTLPLEEVLMPLLLGALGGTEVADVDTTVPTSVEDIETVEDWENFDWDSFDL